MSKKKITTTDHHIFDKSFCTEKRLKAFLEDKSSFSEEDQKKLKYCIDNYSDCWRIWNKVRWDAAMDSRGVQELKEYLGDKFVPYYDSSWELAKEWFKKNPKTENEVSSFYKHTMNYVYNLTIWHESKDRYDYESDMGTLLSKYGVDSVIDFGCGVGTDSLIFLEKRTKVFAVDFICPAVKFFKWRLKKRGLECDILNVEKIEKLPSAEMFWAIDVLEHVPNPLRIIEMIDFSSCKVFAHKSRFNDTAGGRHPCHINFESKLISNMLLSKGFKNVEWNNNLSVWVNLDLVNK